MIKKVLICLTLFLWLAGLTLPYLVWAQKNNLEIGPNETREDNLWTIGQTIIVAGKIKGDILAIGNSIEITGEVAGDVLALGGQVTINGPVGGNIRVAASQVTLNGPVSKNVTVAANNLTLASGAKISGTLAFWAGQVTIDGQVTKRVDGQVNQFNVSGQTGPLYLNISNQGQIKVTPRAQTGDLTYWAKNPAQLTIEVGAKTGQTNFLLANPEKNLSARLANIYIFYRLMAAFGLMVVGLVIITLGRNTTEQLTNIMTTSVWPKVGQGLIYLVVTPLIIIFLLLTIIGVPLAIILIGLYLLLLYLGKVLAAIVLGGWLSKKLLKNKKSLSQLVAMIFGVIILVIISSLPILGWAINCLLIAWSWGGLGAWLKDKKI